jgi:uncharacterized protein YbjT (DUF2867 family)
MKILAIGGTGHVGRLVVDELRARAGDVRVFARQRPRPGPLPGKVKVDRMTLRGRNHDLDDEQQTQL